MTTTKAGGERGLRGLSPYSRRLFRELVTEHGIADAGGRQVLLSGLRSLDVAVAAEERVLAGATITDRFGVAKVHPLSSVARDARSAWIVALKTLNLRPEGE